MSFFKQFLGITLESFIESGETEVKEYLKDKQDDDYYLNLGYTYSSLGKFNKAIKNYKKAIERDPNSHTAYLFIGQEYYFSEQYIEAA